MKSLIRSQIVVLTLVLLFLNVNSALAQTGDTAKYARLDSIRLHYENYGKGTEAFILVHGWGCNLNHWREQIPVLAQRSRVIALDLPGHGKSDKPETAYTMDLFARAVDAVMRDAGVERAVIVGHSMGTPVARQFYRKYPHKTIAIVIVDGGLRLFGTKEQRDNFLAMFRAPNYLEASAPMFNAMAGPSLAALKLEQIKASFKDTPQQVLVSAMEGMNVEAIYATDKINVPVQAILARSPFWAPDTEEFFRSLAPKLEFQMWDGVGHFLMMEKPKEFNDSVIAFVNKNAMLKQ